MVCHSTSRSITCLTFTSPCRDTVQSIGWVSKHLPFCGSNNAITHFRHALALDERRVKFIPSFYAGGKAERERADSKVSEDSESINEKGHHKIGKRQRFERSYEYELYINAMNGQETDAEEVFFSGAHCGTIWSPSLQSISCLPVPFQTSGAGPWKTANVAASPAFPFDG